MKGFAHFFLQLKKSLKNPSALYIHPTIQLATTTERIESRLIMYNDNSANPMTEIALALAMGFFSLMVLTLVSMGAGNGKDTTSPTLKLAPAGDSAESRPGERIGPEDQLVIHFEGRFLDRDLHPLDAGSLDDQRRTVLALAPEIPLDAAMTARGELAVTNLTITALDSHWLETLERLSHENP